MGATKPRAHRPRRAAEAVYASLRLPCDARSRGRAAELASFASLTALRQPRRVRSRCAQSAPATRPRIAGASEARRGLCARAFAEPVMVRRGPHPSPLPGGEGAQFPLPLGEGQGEGAVVEDTLMPTERPATSSVPRRRRVDDLEAFATVYRRGAMPQPRSIPTLSATTPSYSAPLLW